MTVVLVALVAASVCAASPVGLDGSYVSVRQVAGASPYRLVTYDVLWRQKVAVAGHYRGLVHYDEALHRMKLVRTARYVALLDRLEGVGLFSLEDAPEPEVKLAATTWVIEARRGDRTVTARVEAPEAQADPRYAAVVNAIRGFVLDKAGDIPFRNVFFEPGTFGWVNLTSVPPARVYVDGRLLEGLETPIYGYELPVGKHQVKLVSVKEGWEREHELRVEPGMTTIVHFDLR